MDTTENSLNKRRNRLTDIIIAQCVFVCIVIIMLTVTKYFFKSTFGEIKEWYIENVCADTDVNEVLKERFADEV